MNDDASAAAPGPAIGQLGLVFGDEPATVATALPATKPRRRSTAAQAPAGRPRHAEVGKGPDPAHPGAGADDPPSVHATDVEGLARRLEAHPDYRVLRRLQPRLDFGAAPDGADLAHVLVLDTETTGLDARSERVIELALLRVAVDRHTGQPWGVVQVYDGLEDPGRPLPPEIVQITGITDAMLAGQRIDDARVAEMAQGVDLVVAHNAGFDRPFVEARCPQFAQLSWACSWADLDWKAMGQGSAKLENLALALGLFYDAHRAEADCHALLAVLIQPLDPSGESAAHPTRLKRLLEAAGHSQYRLQATGAPFEAKDALKARSYRWDANQKVWGTTLRSEAALQGELAWLKEAVYSGRAVRVRVEAVDARHRYSNRPGEGTMQAVG